MDAPNVNVSKRLTIQSENGFASTIVQAKNSDKHVFKVSADYVDIHGFRVKNANGEGKVGILLKNVNYCNISNNKASNNDVGIKLYESCNNLIMDNIANSNTRPGIGLKKSSNNTITCNIASNNGRSGIGLNTSSNNNIITNNNVNSNDGCGIWLGESCNNTIMNDTVNENNFEGINLDYSSKTSQTRTKAGMASGWVGQATTITSLVTPQTRTKATASTWKVRATTTPSLVTLLTIMMVVESAWLIRATTPSRTTMQAATALPVSALNPPPTTLSLATPRMKTMSASA
jgi:parallel beta-helix repeat protein